VIDSPSISSNLVAPSKLIQAGVRLSLAFLTVILELSGNIRGRKDRECGARGVRQISGAFD
jgi:hypothetical protein